MKIPCPIKSDCIDDSNPVQNLSAEAPDANIFFGYASGPGSYLPRAGGNWNPGSYTGTGPIACASTVSQADADLCATRLGDLGIPPGNVTPTGQPAFFNTIQSCTVFCPDGNPFTYQVAAGLFTATSQILADRMANSYACILANRNKVCMGTINPNACLATAYNSSITVTGAGPFTFTVTAGALPPGLALTSSGNTGVISGTPTSTGNYTFTIRAVNAVGNFMVKSYSISVVGFTNSAPNAATLNIAYSFQFAAAGGTGVFTFAVTAGTLPTGLSLSTAGLLSGTPTAQGTSNVTVTATDSAGQACGKSYSLIVGAPASFQICNFASVAPLLSVGGCAVSANPQWDGVFNLQTTDAGDPGSVIWYFINQSINGRAMAASDAPDYPGGNWQSLDCFAQIRYDAGSGTWSLELECANCGDPFGSWWVGTLVNNNPADPSGVYVAVFPPAVAPPTIEIRSVGYTCCADVGTAVPVNFNPASPVRVRIADLPGFLSSIGACPGCDPAVGAPQWDGTLPVKCTTGPAVLNYQLAGSNCPLNVVIPALSLGAFKIQSGAAGEFTSRINCQFVSGSRWIFEVRCFDTPDKVIWSGQKDVGDTPQGTYVRENGASGGVASGPDCVHIESY